MSHYAEQPYQPDMLDMIFSSFSPAEGEVMQNRAPVRDSSSRQGSSRRHPKMSVKPQEEETDLLDDLFTPMHNFITGTKKDVDLESIARSRDQEIWEERYYRTFPNERPKQEIVLKRYDALDSMFELLESNMCAARGTSVVEDRRADMIKALDADEEANRILSKPKSQWTYKDKNVLKAVVLNKLQEDYRKLGRKVEKLSKYAVNGDQKYSRDGKDGAPSDDISVFADNNDAYTSYHELRGGMGKMLLNPGQETVPRYGQSKNYRGNVEQQQESYHLPQVREDQRSDAWSSERHQQVQEQRSPARQSERHHRNQGRDEDLGWSSFLPFCGATISSIEEP